MRCGWRGRSSLGREEGVSGADSIRSAEEMFGPREHHVGAGWALRWVSGIWGGGGIPCSSLLWMMSWGWRPRTLGGRGGRRRGRLMFYQGRPSRRRNIQTWN